MQPTGDTIVLTSDPLDIAALTAAVRHDSSGAIATFVGVVRNEHMGRPVDHLIYEAYPEMARREIQKIVDEMRSRWQLSGVAIAHRTGRLEIGEASVAVVVAAPHRREALDACSFGIEEIKKSVPIWKKEFGAGGEEWVIGDPSRP